MLSYSENILQTITGKTSLQDVSVEQLQNIVDAYPYFGAAQFFLSKKMFEDKLEGFENALQKTALHFDNMLLLHFNLTQETGDTISYFEIPEKNYNNNTGTEIIPVTVISKEEIIELPADKNSEKLTSIENYNDAIDDFKPVINFKANDSEILHNEDSNQDQEVSSEESDELTDATNEAKFESNEKLSNLLKEQAEAFEKPVAETALPIDDIPHHRIDYFESQGIKLDPEKEPDDKLGTQLKRFTDWLKQMKRINPALNNLETDVAGEIQAQNMAARSNDSKEIITETMAEVLIKQGKPEEAIDIYKKLSFSNPSKSTYFAAKIKELKA